MDFATTFQHLLCLDQPFQVNENALPNETSLYSFNYPSDTLTLAQSASSWFECLDFEVNSTIERAVSDKFGDRIFGKAQVTRKVLELTPWNGLDLIVMCALFAPFNAESGRTDVLNTINDFVFTPASKSAFENFTIVDDYVLEFDELLIAEFYFGPELSDNWNAIKGEPSTAFILIRDDDCELYSDIAS